MQTCFTCHLSTTDCTEHAILLLAHQFETRSVALQERACEATALQNSLCLVQAIDFRLAVLGAHRIVDCEIITAGLSVLNLLHHDVQLAKLCTAIALVVLDLLFLIALG